MQRRPARDGEFWRGSKQDNSFCLMCLGTTTCVDL